MENVIIDSTKVSAILLEPRDLRIGNILLYKNKYVHVTLLSLDIDDEYEETIGFCQLGETSKEHAGWNRALCANLRPIQLTTEILKKCSFQKKNGLLNYIYYESKTADLHLEQKDGFFIRVMVTQFVTYKWPQEIRYLHQLQNLHFALTGEELQVNL